MQLIKPERRGEASRPVQPTERLFENKLLIIARTLTLQEGPEQTIVSPHGASISAPQDACQQHKVSGQVFFFLKQMVLPSFS
jgi:hypothetical protein